MRGKLEIDKVAMRSLPSLILALILISINKGFIHHQIELDDSQDVDILSHSLPARRFIRRELAKGREVLVHCQAGISNVFPHF